MCVCRGKQTDFFLSQAAHKFLTNITRLKHCDVQVRYRRKLSVAYKAPQNSNLQL